MNASERQGGRPVCASPAYGFSSASTSCPSSDQQAGDSGLGNRPFASHRSGATPIRCHGQAGALDTGPGAPRPPTRPAVDMREGCKDFRLRCPLRSTDDASFFTAGSHSSASAASTFDFPSAVNVSADTGALTRLFAKQRQNLNPTRKRGKVDSAMNGPGSDPFNVFPPTP